uniref:Uncharacterized protein n=1 Tax=Ditylum brightwellii TaxID=49249 RepID=A0A6U3QKT8_9STRA|mmetsp:Transcript_21166/g.31435  ORF Transcript_21166/g.31435 Transcript_21166/m.31435 type:complete len:274 (+) Transcript_21166:199-1020(+)
MAPFGVILSAVLLASSKTAPQQQLLEVCLSPGCIADGAKETLSRLCAFAPPGVQVLPGKCASACGAGPVVMDIMTDDKKIVHKRVSGDVLLNLLLEGINNKDEKEGEEKNSSCAVPNEIIEGYEIIIQADDAMSKKDYEEAAALYRQGIDAALQIALDLHVGSTHSTSTAPPPGLEWLIRAHRLEAEARIKTHDAQTALEIATKAWELSNQTNRLCLEVMAQACQELKDAKGELNALRTLLVEMDPEENAPRDVLNRMRTLGFRLAKLEREAK